MPDAPGLELILSDINAETPGAVLDTSFDREQAALIKPGMNRLQVRERDGAVSNPTQGQYPVVAGVNGATMAIRVRQV